MNRSQRLLKMIESIDLFDDDEEEYNSNSEEMYDDNESSEEFQDEDADYEEQRNPRYLRDDQIYQDDGYDSNSEILNSYRQNRKWDSGY